MDLWYVSNMEAILTLQILKSAEFYVSFSCIECAFVEHTIEKFTTKQQSMSIS